MVPGIIYREQMIRMARVQHELIEIHNIIEVPRRPYPLIDRLTIGLAVRSRMIVVRPDVRKNRPANHSYAVFMGSKNDLLVCRLDPPNQIDVFRMGHLAMDLQTTQVIDSFQNDEIPDTRLRQHVPVETRQYVRT